MNKLKGNNVVAIIPHYENFIVYDKYENKYFISGENLLELAKKAMKGMTFEVMEKRTRTWIGTGTFDIPTIKKAM